MPRMTLDRLLLVAVGGALGSALRYALSVGITRVAAGPFPWHTLAINLIGSFGLGVLLFAWPSTTWMTPAVRLGLRFWRTTQLLLEASGFTPLVPGVAHRDRLAVSFPLSGRHGMDLRLSWERTTLPTRALASDGETDVEVAPHALQVVGVQLGMRF